MLRRLVTCAVSLVLAFAGDRIAKAQMMGSGTSAFGSGFGSSGFGSSGFGSSSFGSSSFGSSGFGNAGFGSTRFGSGGMGGLGSSGFGNAGFGSTRFGSGGMGGFGSGSVFGSQGFGMTGFGGQNFVGRDASDMQAFSQLNQMGQAGTQFFNQMNRNTRRERSRERSPAVANQPQPVRVQLQVAFTTPRSAPSAVEMRLRARLEKILPQHNIAQPVITVEGDTAVLVGIASSESERLVLERLVALEPGIRQVRNEMVVASASN